MGNLGRFILRVNEDTKQPEWFGSGADNEENEGLKILKLDATCWDVGTVVTATAPGSDRSLEQENKCLRAALKEIERGQGDPLSPGGSVGTYTALIRRAERALAESVHETSKTCAERKQDE